MQSAFKILFDVYESKPLIESSLEAHGAALRDSSGDVGRLTQLQPEMRVIQKWELLGCGIRAKLWAQTAF
jgi:hypothetical protein